MNLKKIIREELDDFEWISDYEFDVDKTKVGDRFYVNDGTWFEIDKIKWNETIPELSVAHIKGNDGTWENQFYIKDIIQGLNRGGLYKKINSSIKEESGELDWIKKELSNKGPLDGIRFRVPRSMASRKINVIEDKDGDNKWVSVFWQTDDKDDIRSERYSREMVERYLNDGWWRKLN